MSTAIQRVVWKELEELKDDPDKVNKFMDTLYDIAHRKVVEEHNTDMAMVLGMLYRFTGEQKDPTQHQIVLGLMQKYNIPEAKSTSFAPGTA